MLHFFSCSLLKIFILCLLFLGFAAIVRAEPFETIINNGISQNRYDIAVMGDGYTAAEMDKYRADVQRFMNGVFAQEPYREYQRYFNVHRIDVVSNQSGADHPERNPPVFVDTALDSTYNCGGLLRYICINEVKVYDIIFRTLPASHYDVILVLVNDPQSGGAGGQVPVVSAARADSVETILHELGHSFARLADEYTTFGTNCTFIFEPSEANATRETIRSQIKWNHWIDPITPIPTTTFDFSIPGLYLGGRHCETSIYRPTYSSKMRQFYRPFEQINTEQHVKRLYNFVSPIDDSLPAGNTVSLSSNQSQTFTVTTPQPSTHTLNIKWLVDGQQTGSGTMFTINSETLAPGNHTVSAEVSDLTPLVRNNPQQVLKENRYWTINTNAAAQRTPFDFDGDGKADVSVFRPAADIWFPDRGVWYLLNSQSGFSAAQFGVSTDKIVPADYDGDGKTDLAVYRSGTWYLNRSSAGFTGFAFGDSNDIPQPADFDGDGKAELAVWRPSNGVWYIYNLATNQFTAFQFGAGTDKPVVGDYDGDGKADYTVFRPANGTWYLMRSTAGFTGIQFGDSNDKPVPADYDGDGKTDVAVFRPSNGTWYLLRSQTGFTGVKFGISTDLPTPADYDGDGKADVAVFRDGIWYIQRGAAGFTGIQFGASTDKPVPTAFIQQ
ncbi:MAG: M64 family metallopeptidase [Pyrinomonadaceae bacterium]